jgi:hypothetical protein
MMQKHMVPGSFGISFLDAAFSGDLTQLWLLLGAHSHGELVGATSVVPVSRLGETLNRVPCMHM